MVSKCDLRTIKIVPKSCRATCFVAKYDTEYPPQWAGAHLTGAIKSAIASLGRVFVSPKLPILLGRARSESVGPPFRQRYKNFFLLGPCTISWCQCRRYHELNSRTGGNFSCPVTLFMPYMPYSYNRLPRQALSITKYTYITSTPIRTVYPCGFI